MRNRPPRTAELGLTGQLDFAQRTRLAPKKQNTGRYVGVRSNWYRRRYGHFNGQSDFGPPWVAISDWTVALLSRLLGWPGLMRHSSSTGPRLAETFTQKELIRCIDGRLDEIRESFGNASNTPIYRVRVNWSDLRPTGSDPRFARTLRVAVVQSALPNIDTFMNLSADPTLSSPAVHRKMAVHFASVLGGLDSHAYDP